MQSNRFGAYCTKMNNESSAAVKITDNKPGGMVFRVMAPSKKTNSRHVSSHAKKKPNKIITTSLQMVDPGSKILASATLRNFSTPFDNNHIL